MQSVIILVSSVLAVASAGAYYGQSAQLYTPPVVPVNYQTVHPYRANHAYAPVASAYAPVAHGYAHGGYGSEARLVDPAAIAAGAPLPVGDTHDVAAAKAAHLQAHAAVRNAHLAAPGHQDGYNNGYNNDNNGYAPVAPAYTHNVPVAHGYAHGGYGSEARLVDPVAIAAGAPLPGGDTVEVAAAKAAHLQAHAAAKGGHFYG